MHVKSGRGRWVWQSSLFAMVRQIPLRLYLDSLGYAGAMYFW